MSTPQSLEKMESTPSPTASAHTPSTTPTSTNGNPPSTQSRRPPRKSTLTQQQKNQKRQRATQDQLGLLEVEFNKNPTPTAAVRERIAQEINMTERSVQIWFQNRRAKIKLLAKKSIETGEDCDAIPQSYRDYLAQQAMESGKPLARNLLNQPMGFGNGGLVLGESQNPTKVVIQHFNCRSLSIGSWRRVGQNAMDLVIFYSLGEKPCLTYYINNDSAGYKIEFPFSYIKNITLNNQTDEGSRGPGLLVELNRSPNFFMDSSGSGGFYQCGDFTENQQASNIFVHHLGGDPRVLSGQLAKLTLLDSFRNRLMPLMDTNPIPVPMSAPVSPGIPRPASQPNNMPPPPMNVFPEHSFGMGLHAGPRGHKRTRSRSVPAIPDFSFRNQPMPSLHVQRPSTNYVDPGIVAPVPQHANNLSPASTLRIDTSHTYNNMDYRQIPLSAATTGSPSDYNPSPAFFGHGSMEPVQSAGFAPPYSIPYLSPMPEQVHPQASASPLSAMSQHDPIIADHSPPLANIHHSPAADFLNGFSLPEDQSPQLDDEMLSDMYSKQMHLPFRSPNAVHEAQISSPLKMDESQEYDFEQNPFHYGTVDPSELSQGM